MGTKAPLSIFDICLGKRLVKHGEGFLEKLAETRRMAGGGDEAPPKSLKLKPLVPRRSARLNPVPDQKEIDEQTEAKVRKRRRRANIHVPSDAEADDQLPEKTRQRRRRDEVFVRPPTTPEDLAEIAEDIVQKSRRKGRRAEIYVPSEPDNDEDEDMLAAKLKRSRRRANIFVPNDVEADNQSTGETRQRKRRDEVFVRPASTPEDLEDIAEDIVQTFRRKGRRAEIYVPSEPDKEEDEDMVAAKMKRSRRRAGLFVPPEPEEPYTVQKQKRNVRFAKEVQSKLFAMVEASPRQAGRYLRPRVQMGEVLDAVEPVEARRLKRPRGHLRQLPTLTTRQIRTILGSTTQVLSAERQVELIRDSGCMSTCGENGCGSNCLCLLNGIPCNDEICPCIEENCMNTRDDFVCEEPETFRMRIEIANFELAEMSYGPDQSTISSIDDTTISDMYSLGADDVADTVNADGNIHSRPDSRNNTTTTESRSMMDDPVLNDADEVPENEPIPPNDVEFDEAEHSRLDSKNNSTTPESSIVMDDHVSNDADEVSKDEPFPPNDDGIDEAEDAAGGGQGSNNNSDDDDDEPTPYTGPLPDIDIDLTVEHYPPTVLKQLEDVDDESRDSCIDNEWLDGMAVFAGLLKEATRYNHNNASSASRCSVLHPEVFSLAMRLVERDEDEKTRRKAAKIKGAAHPLAIDQQTISQLVVFGSEWDKMLIPMHITGNHWALTVVTRASASAVIFDSLKKLDQRTKELTDRIKAAIKKILEAIQALNNEDKLTGRFKIRLTKKSYRDVQPDDDSCGLFTIFHARRALERGTSNVCTRKNTNDRKLNIRAERRALFNTINELMEFFDDLANQKKKLVHGAGGFLQCTPRPLTLGRIVPRR